MDPSIVTGYASAGIGQSLEPISYVKPELGEHDVRIAITHCGLCHTDIQAIDDFYHITKFPFVPGHEIVGLVSEVGKTVTELLEGERVGVGWQGRACGECEWCKRGEVNMCLKIVSDASWKPYGGFSTSITVDAGFAYPIPEGMPSETAAVLMCAGITVFKPLRANASTPGLRIGILGVGGLGHLAIQFAIALGYEVTAISSSPSKEMQALGLGAHRFLFRGDKNAMDEAEYYFDLLLCTAHAGSDWDAMMDTLKKKGKLILAGFPEMDFRPIDLVAHELSITGTFLGTPDEMREMLRFAQAHAIRPMVELMPMAEINAAIERLKENKVRYRIVLVN